MSLLLVYRTIFARCLAEFTGRAMELKRMVEEVNDFSG